MTKKKTGVSYSPQEFRELKECLYCGHAVKELVGGICPVCASLNLKKCDMSGILLRKGWFTYYTYDIRSDFRNTDSKFVASKNRVIEFSYRVYEDELSDDPNLSKGARDWETRISNTCRDCGKEFKNSKEHYKEYGNYCPDCLRKSNDYNYEQKTTNNKFVW